MKLSVVQTFSNKFRSQIPDPDKVGVFRPFEFQAKFKLFPQNEEMRTELARIQEDKGTHGFLDYTMESCECLTPSDVEFTDANDQTMKVEDFVKSHIIVQQDALLAFWEVVNKGVEEKNSRKSRSR